MRKARIIAIVLSCALGGGLVRADEASHRELVKKLMTVMGVQKDLESSLEMMKKGQMQRMEQLAASTGRSPAETRFLGKKVMELVSEEMSWEKLEEDCIAVYAEAFPEESIGGIIEFFESPAGHKFAEGTPIVRGGMLRITQKRMRLLGPKLQALAETVRTIEAQP